MDLGTELSQDKKVLKVNNSTILVSNNKILCINWLNNLVTMNVIQLSKMKFVILNKELLEVTHK